MAQAFNAFSVATKGYACGAGTTGFFAFAIASKGYICDAEEAKLDGSGTGENARRKYQELQMSIRRDDEEFLVLLSTLAREL